MSSEILLPTLSKKTYAFGASNLNAVRIRVRRMNGMVRDKRISSENMTKIAIFMDGWTLSYVLYDPKLCRIKLNKITLLRALPNSYITRRGSAVFAPGHFDLTEENCALSPSVVVSLITTVIAKFRVNFRCGQFSACVRLGGLFFRVNDGRMLFSIC